MHLRLHTWSRQQAIVQTKQKKKKKMGKKGELSGSECGKFLGATLASRSFSEIADLLRFSFQPALEFTKTDPKR